MKRKIFLTSLIISICLFVTTTTNAGTGIHKSSFTPTRPATTYVAGVQGFNYPSFNNFSSNPTITPTAREIATAGNVPGEGDERKFLTVKLCKSGTCLTPTQDRNNPLSYYYDTLTSGDLEDGDILRFEIYYHNNGNDTYAGVANETSPDATNVQIGIDLNDFSAKTGEPALMIRPKGFIYGDNNEYRVNGVALKDSSNNVIHTATDDVQAFLKEQGLQLQPIAGSAWLNTFGFSSAILNPTQITFPGQGARQAVSVNVSPNYSGNKMWLTFDRLPGCFRYSGAVFFDVRVVKPPQANICQELTASLDQSPININGKLAYPININSLRFGPQNQIPTGAQFQYTASDPNGEFWVDTVLNGAGPGGTDVNSQLKIGTGTATTATSTRKVYYTGSGSVTVNLTGIPDNQKNPTVCKAQVNIPSPVCKDLLVDHPQQVFVNTLSTFKSLARDTNNQTFGSKIRYSVDPGHGLFYVTKPNLGPDNTSPTVNEVTLPSNLLNPQTLLNNAVQNNGLGTTAQTVVNNLLNATVSNLLNAGNSRSLTPNSFGLNSILALNVGQGVSVNNPLSGVQIQSGNAQPSNNQIAPATNPLSGATVTGNNTASNPFAILLTPNPLGPGGPGAIIDPIPNIPANQVGLASIDVDPNTLVYFFAQLAGQNKIHIKPLNTNVASCKRDFSIVQPPVVQEVCEAIQINRPSTIFTNQLSTFNAKALNTLNNTFNGKITYSVTPGYGQFYLNPPNTPFNNAPYITEFNSTVLIPSPQGGFCSNVSGPAATNSALSNTSATAQPSSRSQFNQATATTNTSLTVDPGTEVYFVGQQAGQDVIRISANCSNVFGCGKTFSITAPPVITPVCETLNLTSTPPSPLTVGQSAVLNVRPLDTNNNPLPANTLLNLTSSAGGQFRRGISPVTTATVGQFPVNFENSTQAGDVTVSIAATDPAYSAICSGTIKVNQTPVPQLVCQSVDFNLNEFTTPLTKKTVLERNKIYVMTGSAQYSRPHQNTITYTIDGNYGVFFTGINTSTLVRSILFGTIKNAQNNGTLNRQFADAILLNLTATTITKNANDELYIITFSNTPASRSDVLSVQATGFNNPECIKKIAFIVPPPPQLVCRDLSYSLTDYVTQTSATRLERNKIYTLKANATYNQPNQNTITYTIDGNYGVIFAGINPTPLVKSILFGSIRVAQGSGNLDRTLADKILLNLTTTTLTVNPNIDVYVITFSNTPPSRQGMFSIQATGFSNPECTKTLDFFVPVIQNQCENLRIAPISGDFDPNRSIIAMNILGDFQNHPGDIQLSVDKGTISRDGQTGFQKMIIFTQAQVAASNNILSFTYKKPDIFNPNTDNDTLRAFAVGAQNRCKDQITSTPKGVTPVCLDLTIIKPSKPWKPTSNQVAEPFEVKVLTNPADYKDSLYYNWEISGQGRWKENQLKFITSKGVLKQEIEFFDANSAVKIWASLTPDGPRLRDTNSNIICADSLSPAVTPGGGGPSPGPGPGTGGGPVIPKKKAPEIEKYVYPESEFKKAKKLINIGNKKDTQYVTYMVVVKPGDDIKAAEIFEDAFKITNGKIVGSENGYLEFTDLEINVFNENLNSGKGGYNTILRTPNYKQDKASKELYNDSLYDDNDNKTLLQFQKNFNCKDRGNKICLDSEDFADAVKDFKNGEALPFKNVNTLGKKGAIIIKYQMLNKSIIDDKSCKKLIAALGCGEEFNNVARLKGYKENTYSKVQNDEKAKAKVIVICPFVLSRQAGDVFFHDVIDTGIDVAKCSEVKGAQGPGITPTPKPPKVNPITGTGNLPTNLKLQLPSHDVCRYSNSDKNLEGYNDVLKHFSSTICELRADVAKAWQEQYINKAVSANITRLSRFGENLNIPRLTSLSDLDSVKNKESGVYIKEGDFKIDGNPLLIEKSGKIPAAETYIIKNGDLYINSNIEYGATNYLKPSEIPSAAFIVIDGNIIIDNSVTKMDGIYMAIDLDYSGDGKITNSDSNNTTKNLLKVSGSLIGNVYELFASRIGVGDPLKDEGSVTIQYDERILLNTPPGINELIDIKQAVIPN